MCANHQKQIALAVHNYASANDDRLPAWANGNSWRFSILSFMEESFPDSARQLKNQFLPGIGGTVVGGPTVVPGLQCPSTPGYPRSVPMLAIQLSESIDALDRGIGANDLYAPFVIRHFSSADDRYLLSPGALYGGAKPPTTRAEDTAIAKERPVKLTRISDGLSKTMLFAEQAGAPTRYSGRAGEEKSNSTRTPRPDLGWCTTHISAGWMIAYESHSIEFLGEQNSSKSLPLNWDNCTGLYSFHNGVNAAHCDGSVRFLSEDIDEVILLASLTRSDED